MDELILGLLHALLAHQKLLIQLLTGSESRELNADIVIHLIAG